MVFCVESIGGAFLRIQRCAEEMLIRTAVVSLRPLYLCLCLRVTIKMRARKKSLAFSNNHFNFLVLFAHLHTVVGTDSAAWHDAMAW